VGIVFSLEQIGSTDFAATTHLGANLGQVSLLFIFREEPRLLLRQRSRKKVRLYKRRKEEDHNTS
jgi:hypothetical protein